MLIEVLIAILLFSIGILGLVALQAVSTQNSVNVGERSIAANLANDMISNIWLRNSTDTNTASLNTDITNWQTRVAGEGATDSGRRRFLRFERLHCEEEKHRGVCGHFQAGVGL